MDARSCIAVERPRVGFLGVASPFLWQRSSDQEGLLGAEAGASVLVSLWVGVLVVARLVLEP